jgi:hypothetical protein
MKPFIERPAWRLSVLRRTPLDVVSQSCPNVFLSTLLSVGYSSLLLPQQYKALGKIAVSVKILNLIKRWVKLQFLLRF